MSSACSRLRATQATFILHPYSDDSSRYFNLTQFHSLSLPPYFVNFSHISTMIDLLNYHPCLHGRTLSPSARGRLPESWPPFGQGRGTGRARSLVHQSSSPSLSIQQSQVFGCQKDAKHWGKIMEYPSMKQIYQYPDSTLLGIFFVGGAVFLATYDHRPGGKKSRWDHHQPDDRSVRLLGTVLESYVQFLGDGIDINMHRYSPWDNITKSNNYNDIQRTTDAKTLCSIQ